MTQAFSKMALNALVAGVAMITCGSAHAVVDGEWERPVLRSQMDIVEAQPNMSGASQVELLMTRKDGASGPTGFTLRIDRQMINFEVSKIRRDVCGAELYIGMTSNDAPEHSYRLVVVDHTHETCTPAAHGDYHALPVRSSLEALLLDNNETVLRMTGEPESVITPQ